MRSLQKAVALIEAWPPARDKERREIAALFHEMIRGCEEAVRVWEEYLKAPGPPGDRWSIVSWIGPERAKRLYEINLRLKEPMRRICAAADEKLGRLVHYEDSLIEMAYRQLQPGETGPDAARKAVQRMEARIGTLRDLARRIEAEKAPLAHGAPGHREQPLS